MLVYKMIAVESTPEIREFTMPIRDEKNDKYINSVNDWHSKIALCWLAEVDKFRNEQERNDLNVALLIWGDPSLYDSSIRIFHHYNKKERNSILEVVPGITSIQALTAAHKITINSIGKPFHVTNGRSFRESGWPDNIDTVAVLLDEKCSFNLIEKENIFIWWGAYLGMENEILISGNVAEVGNGIVETRSLAKEKYGWIMDTYILHIAN